VPNKAKRTPDVAQIEGWAANGYLIIGRKIVAVDPGVPRIAREMVDYVEKELGRPAGDITLAAVTHFHIDHIGGLGALQELTGCGIALPAKARPFVEERRRIPFPRPRRWLHMVYTDNWQRNPTPQLKDIREIPLLGLPFYSPPCPFRVDTWLEDGQKMPDAPGWKVLYTPGHSADSICFWHASSGSLMSGDMVLGNHNGPPQANAYCLSRTQTKASLKRLLELPVRRLYPGHGPQQQADELLDGILDTLSEDPRLLGRF